MNLKAIALIVFKFGAPSYFRFCRFGRSTKATKQPLILVAKGVENLPNFEAPSSPYSYAAIVDNSENVVLRERICVVF